MNNLETKGQRLIILLPVSKLTQESRMIRLVKKNLFKISNMQINEFLFS